MTTKKTNKKTAEEGKNVKNKKANMANTSNKAANKKTASNNGKKTVERSDVNSDVDQE